MFSRKLSFVVTVGFALILVGRAPGTPIPTEPGHVRSLDGAWQFKIEQADEVPAKVSVNGKPRPIKVPEHPEAFQTADYKEDAAWHALNVPGNWEMAGFSPATYNQPDNAIGLYRLWFDVPAEWHGRLVRLNFDGVQNGAEIYLNGQPVNVDEPAGGKPNYHEGGYNAFQVDLTPAVKFGEKNLLAIRVYKNTPSVDMDTGDYFFLGGIHRSVTLFSVGKSHIEDFTVQTKVPTPDRANLRIIAKIASPMAGAKVILHVEGQPPVEAAVNEQGQVELAEAFSTPRLWSAEHPNLYGASLDLVDEHGATLEDVTSRIGVREISIRDGVLCVNNAPVKLAGMCRHDLDPNLGSALNEAAWRRDLTLMREANVNAVRTSHYPYGSGFYDLCDEMGFYVADEMAACWTPTDTDDLSDAFKRHAREVVRRDRNHPCVILWAVGNKNKQGKNNKLAADEIRKFDPTRPRLVSWEKAEICGVELDDNHYPKPDDVKRDMQDPRRQTIPKLYLENPNTWEARNGADWGSLDLWGHVMDRAWRDIWADDHLGGSFLWEWADRAVADKSPVKLYDYDPATGINLVKVKGIVDAWRNPRPDYYHVKVEYAPIKIDLKPVIAPGSVTLHARNHLSFTNLSELNTIWHLRKGDKELSSATVHPTLAPWSAGDLKLDLPAEQLADADVLRLVFDHANGLNVVTYDVRLKPEDLATPKLAASPKLLCPQLNLTTVTYEANHVGWRTASRHPARLQNIAMRKADGTSDKSVEAAALYAMPLADIRAIDADVVLAEHPVTIVARAHASYDDGQFSYQLTWQSAAADIQELGWSIAPPKQSDDAIDHFSWHRQALWSYYPADHIGRAVGTASADSAKGSVMRVTRPDIFDFNSTKYDCDWAELTDTSGAGIAVTFAANQRHHCRGDVRPDGTTALIVNKQVSPPRDISSSVVPDLYLKPDPDSKVAGSFAVGVTSSK